jgi:hypothetical protein
MSNVTIPIFNAMIAFSILVQVQPGQIPMATLNSSDEVKQWWEQVRTTGAEAAKAAGQKEEMLKKKRVPGAYEFRADGTIKVLKIVRGLGFGLDEQAVAAVQKIIFLPEIKDGTFVNMSSSLEFTFNLY